MSGGVMAIRVPVMCNLLTETCRGKIEGIIKCHAGVLWISIED